MKATELAVAAVLTPARSDEPVIADPPAEHERESCCTQRTFMIRVEQPVEGDNEHAADAKRRLAQTMKHSQDEYWGDRRWTASWNRRTYVEARSPI